MFKEMRRKDKQLSLEEAKNILAKGEYGVLCLNGDYPYGVPVSYTFEKDMIYIHCALQGYKLDLLQKDCKVCFTVTANIKTIAEQFTVHYESAMLFGRANLLDGEEKRAALKLLALKYSAQFIDKATEEINKFFDKTAVLCIKAEHISGKKSNY